MGPVACVGRRKKHVFWSENTNMKECLMTRWDGRITVTQIVEKYSEGLDWIQQAKDRVQW